MDFTADGKYAIATCEVSGMLVKLAVNTHQVIGYLPLKLANSNKKSMPQDIRLSPDGRTFYVADMVMDGVFLIDPTKFRQIGFIKTGKGTHSLYPSRDGKFFYISNRGCNKMTNCPARGPGSITVLDPTTQKIVATWHIPGGGSPDMGNVNADGKELWLSGKYDHEVYVFDTQTGKLTHRIPVGHFPHGLTVWPQPGRYSLGHTGNMR
jgi:DNA-binding beta-propeller fold protein YncE